MVGKMKQRRLWRGRNCPAWGAVNHVQGMLPFKGIRRGGGPQEEKKKRKKRKEEGVTWVYAELG